MEQPTCPKVDSSIHALQRATLQQVIIRPVCGEQDNIVAKVVAEQLVELPLVQVVTCFIAAILILNLHNKIGGVFPSNIDTQITSRSHIFRPNALYIQLK